MLLPLPPTSRVWRMHVIDAGTGYAGESIAVFQCAKCDAKTGWMTFDTMSEAKRGIPCETCNQPEYRP